MASNKKLMTLTLIALVALAFTGCSSDDPNPAAVIIDTAPPAVPANLQMEYSGSAATISWAQNTVDVDLAGYVIMRKNGITMETLVATPALQSSYVDDNPLYGLSTYQVYAVDTAGNQSAVSSVSLMATRQHARPVQSVD